MGEENLPLFLWRDLSLRAPLPPLPPSAREVSPERSRALWAVWLDAGCRPLPGALTGRDATLLLPASA